jgi:uncharacterized protein YpuA (DUF1002 family)
MDMLLRCAVLAALLCAQVLAQAAPPAQETAEPVAASADSTSLSQDQIRQLFRETADHDMANDKKQRDYTYVEREEDRRVDGKGRVKSAEIKTYDVMEIYGEQVQKLISKDDKPLSEKEAKKEDEKIQKLIDKRRKESAADREKRLRKEEKDREDGRKFVGEVADAYNFRFLGVESLDGRENYVIDAEPRADYKPHLKEAKILPKFRFRAWIDKDETQWRKLDIQCIDTVSFGLFLLRVHKGSRIVIEQTRVNGEVWLQKHITLNADFRLALLKNFDFNVDITDRDYKKFGSDTKIIVLGETHNRQ